MRRGRQGRGSSDRAPGRRRRSQAMQGVIVEFQYGDDFDAARIEAIARAARGRFEPNWSTTGNQGPLAQRRTPAPALANVTRRVIAFGSGRYAFVFGARYCETR
jgi:hypothetical protein